MSAQSPVVILWKDALSAATMGGALSAAFGSRRGLTILANMYGTSFIGMGAGAMMVPKDLFALFKWSYPTEPSAQEVVDRVMMGYGARDIFMGVAMYAVTLFGNSRTLGAILISNFLRDNSKLHLGGADNFTSERAEHLKVFGFHSLDESLRAPIERVEFTAVRGPHGTIPIRIFYPSSGKQVRDDGDSAALVYMHGGGYTVGSVDEFENGLRIVAENSGAIVVGVEYRLAPEWSYPVQLDEYDAVIDWFQGDEGNKRGVNGDKVCGGGDSAGGNMTAALALRRKDQKKKPMKACMLLYPEARLPFDTKAAVENNSGFYLECNGIFGFAAHYATRGVPPSHRYISPGMQEVEDFEGRPCQCRIHLWLRPAA
ncbi:alpha beta hydrolase fold-3 domain protein [Colletotrichum karsti]|uniref:Alpha beta hydrolase fold-3 domain protein n=1 Tax=Colletotrichum karsti TaxID=1095194 RepID=A0A9P6I4K2_9PEZI|nr:alpha beta hydrolase fold-3 domain protein [Colletotrichum karsti]KAF9876822.1 alpha beta hydrolase fold-3 domain protein [Colletotrichum karsti]